MHYYLCTFNTSSHLQTYHDIRILASFCLDLTDLTRKVGEKKLLVMKY